MDFYAISKYPKDPEREYQLQEEIDTTSQFLRSVRNAAPEANLVYLMGNHEDRLRKYLHSGAKPLCNLRNLQFEALLGLPELGITTIPSGQVVEHGGQIIVHGARVLTKGGYTAHKMIDVYGSSGYSGHTHRAAQISRRYYNRENTWTEGGCLCTLLPDYADDVADWQHGFVIGEIYNNVLNWELLRIRAGCLIHDGTLYDGKELLCEVDQEQGPEDHPVLVNKG